MINKRFVARKVMVILMKKIISVFMTITLVLTFAACSNAAQNENASTEPQTQQATTPSSQPENDNQTDSAKKVLVVYFSASGNTENAANYIAKATDGDIFEIVPKDAYTEADLDWTDENSRVNNEHENESERNIELTATTPGNWDSYDTVFIGYPIWWGIAAWPTDTFVQSNDFTGKTVIPFCTSTSSDLGESGKLLEEKAGTGNWLEGKRFSSSVAEEEIVNWVDSLNLS